MMLINGKLNFNRGINPKKSLDIGINRRINYPFPKGKNLGDMVSGIYIASAINPASEVLLYLDGNYIFQFSFWKSPGFPYGTMNIQKLISKKHLHISDPDYWLKENEIVSFRKYSGDDIELKLPC